MSEVTQQQYKDIPTNHPPTEGGGSLPFTGFDVSAMLVVAVGVLALGAWIKRSVRYAREDQES